MSHTRHNKKQLLNRVRRLGGQIEAVERALEEEVDCARVMQLVASTRGAINGLMAELMEEHIRYHVSPHEEHAEAADTAQGANDLIEVMRTYMR